MTTYAILHGKASYLPATPENPHPELYPGRWYVCQNPERPIDPNGVASHHCLPCMIGAQAAFRSGQAEGSWPIIDYVNRRVEDLQ